MKTALWIEDDGTREFAKFSGIVYADYSYKLDIALNASESIEYLWRKNYDAVVVDIRLPSGEDEKWRNLYNDKGYKYRDYLGLTLLYSLLGQKKTGLERDVRVLDLGAIPAWIKSDRFGVLTIEPGLESLITPLDIPEHWIIQKTGSLPADILLTLLNEIVIGKEQ